MFKKIIKFKFTYLLSILILLISLINLVGFYLFLSGPLEIKKPIIIESKLSIYKISNKLYQENVINYPLLFFFITKFFSLKNPIKSGEYMFTEKISPLQVLRILSSGQSIIHKLMIPEGSTVNEIIDKINSEPLLFGEINGKIPEGFLMPSTYFYSYGDQRDRIIDRMRKLMSDELDKAIEKLSSDSPLKTRMDVLILASIIEKETSLEDERSLVAAVFLNRIKKNMKLQADPTTIYAITNGIYKLNRPLSKKDLAVKSPYNTYYILGLPPGPISCPGIKSIEAAINPAKTKALYFVSNGKGGHNFSHDLENHNNHVKQLRNRVK